MTDSSLSDALVARASNDCPDAVASAPARGTTIAHLAQSACVASHWSVTPLSVLSPQWDAPSTEHLQQFVANKQTFSRQFLALRFALPTDCVTSGRWSANRGSSSSHRSRAALPSTRHANLPSVTVHPAWPRSRSSRHMSCNEVCVRGADFATPAWEIQEASIARV